jgi:hypothetical protein
MDNVTFVNIISRYGFVLDKLDNLLLLFLLRVFDPIFAFISVYDCELPFLYLRWTDEKVRLPVG